MSDIRTAQGGMKSSFLGVLAALSVLAAVIMGTYTISAGSMRPRIERIETQAISLEKQFVKIDTQLTNLIDTVHEIKSALKVSE